jgi:adenosylcobinamide-phosphate synthase
MTYESLIYGLSIIVISIIIDMIFGEVPDQIHPVIYMGKIIEKLKNYLPNTLTSGLFVILITMFVFITIGLLILLICAYINQWLFIIIASLILSTTFSINFLIESVRDIQKDLEEDIEKARKSMSYLVSRNTSELTESRITSAAIETLTENITDSIVSPLFYTFILTFVFGIIIGILGAIAYRISNTMDAMLGYKTKELINIGRYPAQLDDILNYIPARITGYYVVLASFILRYDYKQSYDVMKKFALKTPSPNSGYSMAATAGALNVTLVKEGVYELGYGTDILNKEKITQAINITKVSSLLFILTMVILYFISMILII